MIKNGTRLASQVCDTQVIVVRSADSLEDLVGKLSAPRAVWVMVPAGGPTTETITKLGGLLDANDVVIDGGNSVAEERVARP